MQNSTADGAVLVQAVHAARQAIDTIAQATERLHSAMLTGQPHDIADATLRLEEAQIMGEPSLLRLGAYIAAARCPSLPDMAADLRRQGHRDLACEIDTLWRRLRALSQSSATAKRNAENLGRNLATSVQRLRGLGIIREAGLLAEA